jgi:hypothetical protein
MSKKSRKGPGLPAAAPPSKGISPLVWVAALAVVLVGGALALRNPAPPASAATSGSADAAATQKPTAVDPAIVAKAAAAAKLGPRRQENLPPIPFQGYAPPRPHQVVTSAYEFAAEHPEVLSYVPCFCGCERAGHTGNADCFVKSRAANGDVVEWDEHGVECTVCIDVANRSRQMHASGASVHDIRTAIDKEFGPLSSVETPTPHPPGHVQ